MKQKTNLDKLLRLLHTTLSTEEEISLLAQAQTGSKAAQAELCRRYIPLIMKYATARPTECEQEDLESSLWVAFLEGIQDFHLDGPVPFAGFIKKRIMFAQYNAFRKLRKQWQREHIPQDILTAEGLTPFFESLPSDDNIEDSVITADMYQRLEQAFKKLSSKHQELLIALTYEKSTLAEIGQRWHISKQAVHKHYKRACAMLRQYYHTL